MQREYTIVLFEDQYVALIPLGSKQHPDAIAIVDLEDFKRVVSPGWIWGLRVGSDHNNPSDWYARAFFRQDNKPHIVYLHRFLVGVPDGIDVDHKNGNPLDCRRCNMRFASKSQNGKNKDKSSKIKTSKYKGITVMRLKTTTSYRATICYEGKQHYLGMYRTEIEAAVAYNEAALIHHGEFARLNEIEGKET